MCHVASWSSEMLGRSITLKMAFEIPQALSTKANWRIRNINMKNYRKIVFIACITILCKSHWGLCWHCTFDYWLWEKVREKGCTCTPYGTKCNKTRPIFPEWYMSLSPHIQFDATKQVLFSHRIWIVENKNEQSQKGSRNNKQTKLTCTKQWANWKNLAYRNRTVPESQTDFHRSVRERRRNISNHRLNVFDKR